MDLKKLSYDELRKLNEEPATPAAIRFQIYEEWNARAECSRYDGHGKFDQESGIFISNDGSRWKSIGTIDYGNNNFFEVMVPEEIPPPNPSPYAGTPYNNFPVFFAAHEDGSEALGESRETFLANVPSCHLNWVIMQLGSLLSEYCGE